MPSGVISRFHVREMLMLMVGTRQLGPETTRTVHISDNSDRKQDNSDRTSETTRTVYEHVIVTSSG